MASNQLAEPFQQFQPATGGSGGPKWVIGAIVFVIFLMFAGMIGLAIIANNT